MRNPVCIVTVATLLAACGSGQSQPTASAETKFAGGNAGAEAAQPAPVGNAASGVSGRELVNPDHSTMVMLYYDLAKITPPIDNWVEEDGRVKFAPAPDKAAKRAAVRAELQSAAAAVRGVGTLRLTMNANLSDYDPSYGEFSIRALAPSSIVQFNALGEKIGVSFANGRTAQLWRVAQPDSQAIRDKISSANNNIELDVLLKIDEVLPGPGGGTIVTEVLEYEMRGTQNGLTIGRVKVART